MCSTDECGASIPDSSLNGVQFACHECSACVSAWQPVWVQSGVLTLPAIQVTVQSHYMKPTKNMKQFEKGASQENAKKGQAAVEDLQRHNRAREKALMPKK